jgi:uncharacterized membrane protein YqgA involved in biofilm formation
MTFNEEHALETYKSLISISTEGMKALQLVNGGAVVALLAYLGQVSNRAGVAPQVRYAVGLFILGLVAATFTFVTSYLTQFAPFNEGVRGQEYKGAKHGPWWAVTIAVALVSLMSFACGAFAAVTALSQHAGT